MKTYNSKALRINILNHAWNFSQFEQVKHRVVVGRKVFSPFKLLVLLVVLVFSCRLHTINLITENEDSEYEQKHYRLFLFLFLQKEKLSYIPNEKGNGLFFP